MVVGIAKRKTTGVLATPTGWNLVRLEQIAGSYQQAVYWRRATTADVAGTTYAFSTGNTENAAGALTAYRGVDTVTAVLTSSGQTVSGTTAVTAPSLTTTKADTRLVGLFGAQGGRTLTTPAGMLYRQSGAVASGPAADQVIVYAHDEPWVSASATGVRTATANANSNAVGQLVTLKAESYPLADVTWTASGSAFRDGYRLGRSVGGTEVAVTSLAAGSTSHTVGSTTQLTPGTAYTLQLRAKAGSWLSGATTASFTAISTC